MLVGKIVASEFAEAEEAAVFGNGVKTHAAAELFKENVVGMRKSFGEIHVLAAADFEHGVAGDYIFFESGDGDGGLDGGARDVAVAKRNFLIYNREDAAGIGIDGDDGAVVAAESINHRFAHDGIIKGDVIGAERIGVSRNAAIASDSVAGVSFRFRFGLCSGTDH